MEHVCTGRVDETLSPILRQRPAKVCGALVGVIPAKVSINAGEDALCGFNRLLRGAFGRGAISDQDDAGGVVLPSGTKRHFNVGAEIEVESLKLPVVESLEGFDVSGKAVDACALLQRVRESHKALPKYLAPGGAGGVAGVDVGTHGAGCVT